LDGKRIMSSTRFIPYEIGTHRLLTEYVGRLKRDIYRLGGHFSFEDQINISNYSELPMFFLKHGTMIPHPYGITLSVDRMGADCWIGQNITVGTSGKNMNVGDFTHGHRPILGNLVMIYPGSVISGRVNIGDMVIVAARTFVDKDIPSRSIVYGDNDIHPLSEHHYTRLADTLYHCIHIRDIVPGIVYHDGELLIDTVWRSDRDILLKKYLDSGSF
jgi:acetyltransferase-like isoleucine patch superfamily enzyme